jgi:hypothetical protein
LAGNIGNPRGAALAVPPRHNNNAVDEICCPGQQYRPLGDKYGAFGASPRAPQCRRQAGSLCLLGPEKIRHHPENGRLAARGGNNEI